MSAMKLSKTDKKILNLLNSDITQEYPVEYITETIGITPGSFYNSISKLKRVYPIEVTPAPDNKVVKYYSLKS